MREVKTKAFLLWVMKQNLERKMLLLLLKTKLLHKVMKQNLGKKMKTTVDENGKFNYVSADMRPVPPGIMRPVPPGIMRPVFPVSRSPFRQV